MDNKPGKLVPALIGGGVIGLLSAVPIINFGNCLCCMWVLLGGFLAAYFYQKEFPEGVPFQSADGVLVGLLAGVFGALFGTFLNYFFVAVTGMEYGRDFFEGIMESGDIPVEVEDLVGGLFEDGFLSPFFVFIQLLFSIVIDGLFGLIGGAIGASVFKKKKATVKSSENESDNA